MHCKLLSGITWTVAVAVTALFPAVHAMNQSAYSRLEPFEKDIIHKLEALPEEVRLCMLAELFSVIPTNKSNYAVRPAHLSLPGKKDANFDDIASSTLQKQYRWYDLWKEVYGGYLMAVGFVYADDIAKLRKLNAPQQRHAQDVLKQFGKVNVRVLDAFFTEMYYWSDRVGNATNVNSSIYGSDHHQYRWGSLYSRYDSKSWEALKPLWSGNKGLLEMQYAAQISKLRLYNCKGTTETGADRLAMSTADIQKDIQKEKAQQKRATKNLSKEVDTILKGMQNKLDAASRQAFLACLADGMSVQDALSHTYVNPDGELRFVYEDLLNGCCVEEFLQLLQKASAAEVIGQAVLDKFDKKVAAMKKSKSMRSLLLQATQKQFEADLALMEAKQMNSATAESGDSAARSAAAMIDNVKDPLCRAALVAIATEKMTPDDLFVQAVFDDESIPHSCYDVLSRADMADKAADLMVKVHACDGLRADMAAKYDAEVQARESTAQKRDGLVQIALKTHEAQEARKHLKKVRND